MRPTSVTGSNGCPTATTRTSVPDAALSGVKWQRSSRSPALLADAPILVLDEATAFADPESNNLVQQSLSRLARDRRSW